MKTKTQRAASIKHGSVCLLLIQGKQCSLTIKDFVDPHTVFQGLSVLGAIKECRILLKQLNSPLAFKYTGHVKSALKEALPDILKEAQRIQKNYRLR